jgi:hypothetical protein
MFAALLEEIQFILHGCNYQVVFSLLVVLRFFFGGIARSLRGLRSFVDLLVLMLEFCLLFPY